MKELKRKIKANSQKMTKIVTELGERKDRQSMAKQTQVLVIN